MQIFWLFLKRREDFKRDRDIFIHEDVLVVVRRIKVVSQEEWLTARLGLLKAEKELTHLSDEVARRRQSLPWVRIDKRYRGRLS